MPPSYYYKMGPKIHYEFKSYEILSNGAIGFNGETGDYGILKTLVPWSDQSGGIIVQTFSLTKKFPLEIYQRSNGGPDLWGRFVLQKSLFS